MVPELTKRGPITGAARAQLAGDLATKYASGIHVLVTSEWGTQLGWARDWVKVTRSATALPWGTELG